ncbi:hypothetical protein EON80_09560, partial [bacterium]
MPDKDEPQTALEFFINTAPEMDALERAAADGKHGRNFSETDDYSHNPVLRHSIPGSSHYVEMGLTPEELAAGLTTQALETLARQQDADASLCFLYIAHVLAAPLGQASSDGAIGTIDFDDVISKIGWDPRSTVERREMHRRVHQFIRFGERAQVIGDRRGTYKDKHTGEVIDTVIRSSPWRILTSETPEQKSLFSVSEPPVRVEIAMSREWTKLLTSPQTAQYLPMGEMLGSIPGKKPSGAWARVVGLALASFWRRLPREAIDGSIKPTRRELLTRYPPSTGPVEELLASKDPRLAIDYWCGALSILVTRNLLEKTGEAAISAKDMRKALPRQGWTNIWLDEKVSLTPGENMRDAIVGRAKALPVAPVPRK